ncbi:uncharacterized protein CEXT_308341 [Caerostris extrusa]|uniref:Uncharacterized protein n=1 Tax=Caerostris extrusa TaxID=172846 RepID=A0AAV4TCM2_CAEEX|nr:uncharacterized protein CEXT_308341 [Caerostris extrusa]
MKKGRDSQHQILWFFLSFIFSTKILLPLLMEILSINLPPKFPAYRDWAILGLLSMVSYRLVVPHPEHEFGVDSSASLLPFILSLRLDTLGLALI